MSAISSKQTPDDPNIAPMKPLSSKKDTKAPNIAKGTLGKSQEASEKISKSVSEEAPIEKFTDRFLHEAQRTTESNEKANSAYEKALDVLTTPNKLGLLDLTLLEKVVVSAEESIDNAYQITKTQPDSYLFLQQSKVANRLALADAYAKAGNPEKAKALLKGAEELLETVQQGINVSQKIEIPRNERDYKERTELRAKEKPLYDRIEANQKDLVKYKERVSTNINAPRKMQRT